MKVIEKKNRSPSWNRIDYHLDVGNKKATETENAHRTLRSMMRECRELDPWRFFNPPGEKGDDFQMLTSICARDNVWIQNIVGECAYLGEENKSQRKCG